VILLRYFFKEFSDTSLGARELIRNAVGADARISKKENGMPYLENYPFFISISHSKNMALAGISEKPIGVDIEVIRDFDKRLIPRFFTESEQDFIRCDEDFFKVWTVKEAYLKLTGEGLKNIKFNCVTNGKLYIEGYNVLSFTQDGCAIAIVYK
jgi:4'-phosphopantetheinyl transferase